MALSATSRSFYTRHHAGGHRGSFIPKDIHHNSLLFLRPPLLHRQQEHYFGGSTALFQARPKQGSVVDSYRTVQANCAKCRQPLFKYKKKNGTKSNLVKCYVERIAEDFTGLLPLSNEEGDDDDSSSSVAALESIDWNCPNCQSNFARARTIHGRPALKMVGGKTRMTK